jgi:hypothetical protein
MWKTNLSKADNTKQEVLKAALKSRLDIRWVDILDSVLSEVK